MRVAVLCDIHGNLPALEAVLADASAAGVEAIVIGGDVATGPLPGETLDRLAAVEIPVIYLRGNADREAVAAWDEGRSDPAAEPDPVQRESAFVAGRLTRDQRDLLADLPSTVRLTGGSLGAVLCCHGSPRSDAEILTSATREARWAEVLRDVPAPVVIAGHTHRQFERRVAGQRFVNAGSVGRPYEGRPGAFWAMIGDDVSLRATTYDVEAAVDRLRPTGFPDVDGFLRESLTAPADPDEVAALFESAATGT